MISDNKYIVPEEYEIISPAVSEVLNMGRAINMSEIVRDFDGWSWNINQENIEDIFKNFLYQSLNLVVNLEEITTIHTHLRQKLGKIPLLYGGSVKPNNVKEILQIDSVDGVLVGSSSWEISSFLEILKNSL